MTESIQILMEKDRLQPLADNIKVLKGSDTITLQQMEDTIEETNTDIFSQANLITQLANALQGKSVPGGSGASVETCTFTVNGGYGCIIGATVLDNSVISTVKYSPGQMQTLDNVVCGAIVYMLGETGADYSCNNCSIVHESYTSYLAIAIDSGVTSASVTVQSDLPPEP